jgi:hypothetical protein
MAIKANVNGLNANILVDTRATVTLVSVKLFESMTSAMMTGMKREILDNIRFVPQTVRRLYDHESKYYPLQH